MPEHEGEVPSLTRERHDERLQINFSLQIFANLLLFQMHLFLVTTEQQQYPVKIALNIGHAKGKISFGFRVFVSH